ERADGTRPVIAHSGVLPHAGSGGTDTHVYFGWYHGDERDFAGFCRAVPRLARFVTEFGAQAVPETAGFMEPERWPDLDWARLARTHALQKSIFDERVPPDRHATFEEWRSATQAYQGEVVKHHVETLRRLKYRPTGGFCQFSFADGHPAVTWSVLDHERVPKAAWHDFREACRPVIVVAERLPSSVASGHALALDVHVVSDLRHPLHEALVNAELHWPDGGHSWRWQGEIPADSCVRVGTVQFVVPDGPGPLVLSLELSAGSLRGSNRYTTTISRSGGGDAIIGSR
ncbi:MAG: hypothetical protein H0U26_05930, partial [Acidimicrobiia bacterium]|nr:hypothetical protein [Acidimicrobiia bacterium]